MGREGSGRSQWRRDGNLRRRFLQLEQLSPRRDMSGRRGAPRGLKARRLRWSVIPPDWPPSKITPGELGLAHWPALFGLAGFRRVKEEGHCPDA